MAMGERNSVGRHFGPAVGPTEAFVGDYRFNAAEKAWFDRASQPSNHLTKRISLFLVEATRTTSETPTRSRKPYGGHQHAAFR
jgi:hypothetical protein